MKIESERSWTLQDFTPSESIVCDPSKHGEGLGLADPNYGTLIGQQIVPPKAMYGIGWRKRPYIPTSGGIIFIKIYDSAGNIAHGEYTLVLVNASRTRRVPIVTINTRKQNYTTPFETDKVDLYGFGYNLPSVFVKEDGIVKLFFNSESGSSVTLNFMNVNNLFRIDYLLAVEK